MADRNYPWLAHFVESAQMHALNHTLTQNQAATAAGSRGSSTNLLAGALAAVMNRLVLLVVAHLDEADEAMDDLELFNHSPCPLQVQRFGALEILPGETTVNLELLAERLHVVKQLIDNPSFVRFPGVLVCPIQAIMQPIPRPQSIGSFMHTIKTGDTLPPARLTEWLIDAGYQRQDAIEQPGDFAIRGGIIDLYPPAGTVQTIAGEQQQAGPLRLDFFGDEIDSISGIDTDTMGSFGRFSQAGIIGAATSQIQNEQYNTNLLNLLNPAVPVVLHEVMELAEQARGYYERLTDPAGITTPREIFAELVKRPHIEINQYSAGQNSEKLISLPLAPLEPFSRHVPEALDELGRLASTAGNHLIVLCAKQAEQQRLRELIAEHIPLYTDHIRIQTGYLHRGFQWHGRHLSLPPEHERNRRLILVPHHELFHRYEVKRRVRRVSLPGSSQGHEAFLDLSVGDYVVHIDHGIARFTGIKTMTRGGRKGEYLTLEFAGRSLLHVPATQIDLVQKYIGGFHGRPPLSTLGGRKWSKQKQAVADAVKDLAAELLRVQAARSVQNGIRFPEDTAWQKEFEAEFPYEETEDQLAAIAAVKHDMTDIRPMDRLICGDVGFGKTEVAIRAAFKAAEYGKQVALLVPTTVLAEQHERTFRDRMADYPFRVESISRFKNAARQNVLLNELKHGRIDIMIGTHRLLSKDVRFADLGLVIIDEEQRFGVEHKNRLLELRLTADVLTLTATPIPRTLHMAMIGLRDIASLSIPPVDRRAIVTEVVSYDRQRIRQAVHRELNRDGQVFFVHNRVHNIDRVAHDLQKLLPDARILVGHGRMSARELESVMVDFIRRQADILVCTTIIESGIDIPTANTMFINDADRFGLADLHQLRGRVGRYKHRAYCYLLLPQNRTITETATKRLKAIEQYAMLGAGFKIAMRDLEIRGAGNLLGSEQSGHIASVGYEMYCLLLERETKRLKNQTVIEPPKTHLELPVHATLPKDYISSDKYRMEAYRRLCLATSQDELEQVVRNLQDAYGPLPMLAKTLVELTEITIAAGSHGIDSIKLDGPDLIFKVTDETHAVRLKNRFTKTPGRASIIDPQTVYFRPPANYLEPGSLLAVLRNMLVRKMAYAESAD